MAAVLVIRTTKAEYVGGDTLYGAVYLKVSGPTAAFGIWIRLYGFVSVSFNSALPSSSSLVHGKGNDSACSTEPLIDTGRKSLYEFEGSIALGQYVFPFSVELSKDLPASTEVKWSNGKAEVCYRVEAVLMGAESVMASQRVCIKQPSLAQSMLQDSQSESEERVDDGQVPRDSKVVQLKTQLPFIKSQLTVTASLDRQEYHAGDMMKLQLRLDFRPGLKPTVSHLSLQLLRETRLSLANLLQVDSSLFGNVKRSWSQSFGTLVSDISCMSPDDNCIYPEQSEDGSACVVWDSGRVYDKDGSLLIKGFDDLLIPLRDVNAPNIPATTYGHIVTVLYTLKIEFTFERNSPIVMNIPVFCIWQRNSEWHKWKPAAWTNECRLMTTDVLYHAADGVGSSKFSSLPGFDVA